MKNEIRKVKKSVHLPSKFQVLPFNSNFHQLPLLKSMPKSLRPPPGDDSMQFPE